MVDYPNKVVVQVRISTLCNEARTSDEMDWRLHLEQRLDELLASQALGEGNGGQWNGDTVELLVLDIERAVKLLIDRLTEDGLIDFCKIASSKKEANNWTVHHPRGTRFSIGSLDTEREK